MLLFISLFSNRSEFVYTRVHLSKTSRVRPAIDLAAPQSSQSLAERYRTASSRVQSGVEWDQDLH
jgi:hypothetical protein